MDDTSLYLDLLKRVLVNVIYRDPPQPTFWYEGVTFDEERRTLGKDWPSLAHTMVGLKRLDNVQYCVEQVLRDGVPGDLIETGVWRGGVCILMRAVLRAHGITDRTVWLADSFEGIPDTGPQGHQLDREMALHEHNHVLGVSEDVVRDNFRRYGLLDDQVRFLTGWFSDTLPGAPVDRLSVLRLDGDLYDSTMQVMENLYPRLSPGGFVIVDDFEIPACRAAIHDFRERERITEEIVVIDDNGVYWRRS
jgi:hypothetical protein